MPKEKLNYERSVRRTEESVLPGTTDKVEGAAWDEMLPVVSIHWMQDNYAQYGVKLDTAQVKRVLAESPDASYLEFFTEALERREMNDGVRVIRRARNAVHGADE